MLGVLVSVAIMNKQMTLKYLTIYVEFKGILHYEFLLIFVGLYIIYV